MSMLDRPKGARDAARPLADGLTGLAHPGPRAPDRRQAVRTRLLPLTGTLRAGGVAMEEIARLFAGAGCAGGLVWLDGAEFDPFRFVLPAHAQDAEHAAWYSATYAPDGPVRIQRATAMVGRRDGAAFLHCHGLWTTAAGAHFMGHLLPFDSRLAQDVAVQGLGCPRALFDAQPDPETNFTLFAAAGPGDPQAEHLLARLRPDEDVTLAIEALCRDHGILRARIHGIGSISHVLLQDGTGLPCTATEIRLSHAALSPGPDGPRASISVEAVDVDGRILAGVLLRGRNPVGVTFELIIETLERSAPA